VDQLLIALDVESGARALALADARRGAGGGFKIGHRLITAEGPANLRELADRGDRVFLDLTYHALPTTVATAGAAATSLGAWMVNVHTAGGLRMMQAAADAARTTAAAAGRQPPLVIGVTVLTSMNAEGLAEVGIGIPVVAQVERLARLARDAGLDGVVASPQETSLIRRACGDGFTIVTPGIRGGAAASAKDDQERTMTAGEAVRAGASYLVVGRPIIGAPDPREAAERIGAEIRAVVVQ
jgi:orotidine-5'-phosphate decarboxylase